MNTNVLSKIVQSLKDSSIKNIMVLTGAGISCSSGIPDFRSPGGLYNTLDTTYLTASSIEKNVITRDPSMIVNYELFKRNQLPYLEVRRPFILGTYNKQWKPTLSHFFIKLLSEKNILKRLYTQNIDGLDSQLQLPIEKVVYVHGSLADISCEFCHKTYSNKQEFYHHIKYHIKNIYQDKFPDLDAPLTSSNILCPLCNKPGVKPSTVLFGRNLSPWVYQALNEDFPSQQNNNEYNFDSEQLISTDEQENSNNNNSRIDLVIVIGT